MQITVTGRHMGVNEALEEYCLKKVERLQRYYDRVHAAEVILDGNNGLHSAEIIVRAEGTPPFVASEEHEDAFAAVDLVLDKVERQIRRHKEKVRNRKHPPKGTEEPGTV